MTRFVPAAFVLLHGLVHLLYFAQSQRYFELEPGMVWPDGSWALAKPLGLQATRALASVCCVVAAIGFAGGAAGLIARRAWWRPAVVASAALSAAVVILFWDGQLQDLATQGLLALAIDAAILIAVLVLGWPRI